VTFSVVVVPCVTAPELMNRSAYVEVTEPEHVGSTLTLYEPSGKPENV
jgi:hypothetical protein